MAQEDAKIKMSADDREVERAWARQFAHLDRLERKLDQVGTSGADSALKGMKSFATWAAGIAVVKAGLDALTAHFDRAAQANQDFQERASRTTQESGDWLFKLAKQGGMSALPPNEQAAAIERMRQRIVAIDSREGLREHTSMRHAKEAFSQGAKGDIGDIADFFGKLSVGIDSENPETLVQSVVGLTKSVGLEPTLENLKKTGIGMQRSFLNEPMQLPDFAQLASRGRGISGMSGADIYRVLAMGSVLREVMPGEKGATAAEAIFTRMATAGGNATRVEALGMVGMKPQDVDMEGEDAVQALERWGDALQKVDKVTANIAVNKFFGEGSTSAFLQMVANTGEIRRREQLYNDPEGFERDVEFMRKNNPAALVRGAQRAEDATEYGPGFVANDIIKSRFATVGREQGYSEATIKAWQKLYELNRSHDVTPQEAAERAIIGRGPWWEELFNPIDTISEGVQAEVWGSGNREKILEGVLNPAAKSLEDEIRDRHAREREIAWNEFRESHYLAGRDPDALAPFAATTTNRQKIEKDFAYRAGEIQERMLQELQRLNAQVGNNNGARYPGQKVTP